MIIIITTTRPSNNHKKEEFLNTGRLCPGDHRVKRKKSKARREFRKSTLEEN